MHIDLNRAGPGEGWQTEVCVIGAGAAGIALTRRLLRLGHRVMLLESGGLDYEARIANLNAGENVGQDYYDLEDSRLRFFGGTTAIWGGRVAELDPIDFEKRDWVPHSGWPFGIGELANYYAVARGILDLPVEAPLPADLAAANIAMPPLAGADVELKLWSFDERFSRFTFGACRDLVLDPRCTIVTQATVTEIVANEQASTITEVKIASPRGKTRTVGARAFVLAAGGIENPRILLASRSKMSCGLGNAHDQVGRFFMEHPHARGGRIVTAHAWSLLKSLSSKHLLGKTRVAALVAASPDFQRRARILNTSFAIAGRRPATASQPWGMRAYHSIKHSVAPTKAGRSLWMYTKKAANIAQRATDPLRPWLGWKAGILDLALVVRAEQAPNPDSRVMLSDEVDMMGTPRVKLDWRTSALDVDSLSSLVGAFGASLRNAGLGDVEPAEWLSDPLRAWRTDELISSHPIGGYHHMGTTRMAADPRQGVTNADTRVHGIANLYIAGSSLFPTGGWANPTLTILALALRTADKLSLRLGEGLGA